MLSKIQYELVCERVAQAGLQGQVAIRLQDSAT
jgi:cyclopropane fatty-acyl-phospholipid synthase-like methyltransferase